MSLGIGRILSCWQAAGGRALVLGWHVTPSVLQLRVSCLGSLDCRNQRSCLTVPKTSHSCRWSNNCGHMLQWLVVLP